jgi:hypothetical protein
VDVASRVRGVRRAVVSTAEAWLVGRCAWCVVRDAAVKTRLCAEVIFI